jgi:glycosyltransferase involved in cell wall biosynthesis
MKVLHFYKTYLPDSIGGIEQAINQIARSSVKLGVTTTVMSLSSKLGERVVEVDGHLVHRCRTTIDVASTPFSISAFYHFRKLAQQADLIHYHFPYPFADILHFVCGINKPCVVTYHSDIVKQENLLKLYRPLQNRFLKSMGAVVAGSPNYLHSSSVLSRLKDKVEVIPYGLDKNSYPVPDSSVLNKWKSLFGDKFFLYIGVLRYYKGLHILIDAAKKSNHPVLIVGAGPVEKKLKKQAVKAGLKNIHFLGFVNDVDKVALLTLAYALVFPSHLRSEAFGISLLEGAMYGKPLISCEIGTGTTFINIDKETGLVVPPNDADALHQAIDYIWNNPKEAALMGEKAEARYWKLFTAEKMAKSYTRLYHKLLNGLS